MIITYTIALLLNLIYQLLQYLRLTIMSNYANMKGCVQLNFDIYFRLKVQL